MDDLPTLTTRHAVELFGDDTGAATAEYAIATMATMGAIERTSRDAVVARVTLEERWIGLALARHVPWSHVARPTADGGLGYLVNTSTLRARLAGYEARRRAFLAEAREIVHLRLVEAAQAAVTDADRRADVLDTGPAFDRWLDAEARLERTEAGDFDPVGVTREMRTIVERALAFETAAALAFVAEPDRSNIARTLLN